MAGQLELQMVSPGWYSILIAGTKTAVLMAVPMDKAEATETMRWLESLTDWTLPVAELRADADLSAKVAARREEIMGAYYAKG